MDTLNSHTITKRLKKDRTALWSQAQVDEKARGWHRSVYNDIYDRLAGQNDFPCVFSKNAIRKNLLKFIFVEGCRDEDFRHLAQGLTEFVAMSENWDGCLNTAYPLVVAFSKRAIDAESVSDFQSFGWKVLQRLHALDPKPWPENVSQDPQSATWSMCFAGMPIFCNMSNPAHRLRASRNLGMHFTLIINPRDRFDHVAGDTPAGRKARRNIRERIRAYDGQPHSPQLGSYGDESLEWWQYGLTDENADRSDICPFHQAPKIQRTCPNPKTSFGCNGACQKQGGVMSNSTAQEGPRKCFNLSFRKDGSPIEKIEQLKAPN